MQRATACAVLFISVMKRSSRLTGLFVLTSALTAAAATLLVAPSAAEACSMACVGGKPVFADRLLPSGVAGLVMPLHSSGGDPDLKLNGVPVAMTYEFVDGLRVLVPAKPLADGAYSLTYHDSCGADATQKTEFSVGAAVPAPEKTGSVNVVMRFVAGVKNQPEQGPPVVGRCGDGIASPLSYDHVDVTVTFAPANELRSYLPAMRFATHVTGPGPGAKSSFTVSPDAKDGIQAATMTVACNATAVADANRQGIYTIEVAGKLLGSGASLPSSITSVDVTCPAGAGANDGTLAIAPGFLGDDTSGSNSGGGCSVGTTRSGDVTYGAAGVALVGLALGARRRRARA